MKHLKSNGNKIFITNINKNVVQNIAFMAQEVRAVENFVDKEADKLYKSCAIQDGAGVYARCVNRLDLLRTLLFKYDKR